MSAQAHRLLSAAAATCQHSPRVTLMILRRDGGVSVLNCVRDGGRYADIVMHDLPLATRARI